MKHPYLFIKKLLVQQNFQRILYRGRLFLEGGAKLHAKRAKFIYYIMRGGRGGQIFFTLTHGTKLHKTYIAISVFILG